MNQVSRGMRALIVCASLGGMAETVQAAWMDFLFGKKATAEDAAPANRQQRIWRIGEFTAIQLTAREPGGPENQHPTQVQPEALRQALAQVRLAIKSGSEPLFAASELSDLIESLAEAFANAGPSDDVLLLSTHRRSDGVLAPPRGITARLFVQAGALQLIVHDARLDFVNAYIGSRIQPTFTFGSRTQAGAVSLQSAAATARRGDWLSVPLAPAAPPLVTPPAASVLSSAPATAPPTPAVVAPAATTMNAPAATTAAPTRPREAASADEIEQRLITLKRLRDKGLISEEEYQQKRREVIDKL